MAKFDRKKSDRKKNECGVDACIVFSGESPGLEEFAEGNRPITTMVGERHMEPILFHGNNPYTFNFDWETTKAFPFATTGIVYLTTPSFKASRLPA
jgi:hypothetical protein